MAKKYKKVNWNRVFANGGLAFCTTMLGFGAIAGMSQVVLFGALSTSLLTGGVALFTEMKQEDEGDNKLNKFINASLLV